MLPNIELLTSDFQLLEEIEDSNDISEIVRLAMSILSKDIAAVKCVRRSFGSAYPYVNKDIRDLELFNLIRTDSEGNLLQEISLAHVELIAILAEYYLFDLVNSDFITEHIKQIDVMARFNHHKALCVLSKMSDKFNPNNIAEALNHIQPSVNIINILLYARYILFSNSMSLRYVNGMILDVLNSIDRIHILKRLIFDTHYRGADMGLVQLYYKIAQKRLNQNEMSEFLEFWRDYTGPDNVRINEWATKQISIMT